MTVVLPDMLVVVIAIISLCTLDLDKSTYICDKYNATTYFN